MLFQWVEVCIHVAFELGLGAFGLEAEGLVVGAVGVLALFFGVVLLIV